MDQDLLNQFDSIFGTEASTATVEPPPAPAPAPVEPAAPAPTPVVAPAPAPAKKEAPDFYKETVKQLADDREKFDPAAHYADADARADAAREDPAAYQQALADRDGDRKLALDVERYRVQNHAPFSAKRAADSVGHAFTGLIDTGKGAYKLGRNAAHLGEDYAEDAVDYLFPGDKAANEKARQAEGKPTGDQRAIEEERKSSEIASAAGQAGTGIATLLDAARNNLSWTDLILPGSGMVKRFLDKSESDEAINDRLSRRAALINASRDAANNKQFDLGFKSPAELAKTAEPTDPEKAKQVEQQITDDTGQMSSALQMAAIPTPLFDNPVTQTIGGVALRGTGKLVQKAASTAPLVGAAIGLMKHDFIPAAVGYALKGPIKSLGKAVGSGIENAGNEMLGGSVPKVGFLGNVGRKSLQAATLGGIGGAEFALGSERPEDVIGSVLGGAAAGPVMLLDPAALLTGKAAAQKRGIKDFERWAKSNAADIEKGQQMAAGDQQNAAGEAMLSPQDRLVTNLFRGKLGGLQDGKGQGLKVRVLEPDAFIQTTGHDGKGSHDPATNTIYINADPSRSAGDKQGTLAHETGHAVDYLSEWFAKEMKNSLGEALEKHLYDEKGDPIPEFQQFITKYRKSMGRNWRAEDERDYFHKEFVAQTAEAILGGTDLSTLEKSGIGAKVRNAIGDFARNHGILPKATDASLNWTEVPAITSQVRGVLKSLLDTAKVTDRMPEPAKPGETPGGAPGEAAPKVDPRSPEEINRDARHEVLGINQTEVEKAREEHIKEAMDSLRRNNGKRQISEERQNAAYDAAGEEFDARLENYLKGLEATGQAHDPTMSVGEAVNLNYVAEDQGGLPAWRMKQTGQRPEPQGWDYFDPANARPAAEPEPAAVTSDLSKSAEEGAATPAPVSGGAPESSTTIKPGIEQHAHAVTVQANMAEQKLRKSKSFAKKSATEQAQEVKKTRVATILGLATREAAQKGDTGLLQARGGAYTGRVDLDLPSHRALFNELGVSTDKIGQLSDKIGQTVYFDYGSAPKEIMGEGPGGIDRSGKQREKEYRASPAQDRAEGGETFEQGKSFVPVGIRVTANGEVTIQGFSPDRMLSNLKQLIELQQANKRNPGYAGVNDPLVVQDVKGYAENHKNNAKGDGSGPIAGKTITPGYVPYEIPQNRFQTLNAALQGQKPAALQGGARGQEVRSLAELNARPINRKTGDTNPLRAEIDLSGKMVTKNQAGEVRKGTQENLEPVYESLRPDLVGDISEQKPASEVSVRPTGFKGSEKAMMSEGRPQDKFVQANFKPRETDETKLPTTKDPFTGRQTILGGPSATPEQSAAARAALEHAAGRAREAIRSLRGGRSVEGSPAESDAGSALGQFREIAPIHKLSDFGLHAEPDGLKSDGQLKQIGSGAEAQVFEAADGTVYKFYRPDETTGGHGLGAEIYKDQGRGGLIEAHYSSSGIADVLEKLHIISALGGAPSELVGIAEGHLVIKQPKSPDTMVSSHEHRDVLDAALVKRIPKDEWSHLDKTGWVGVVDGQPYYITDLHSRNYVRDNADRPRIVDAVVSKLEPGILADLPNLSKTIEELKGQEAKLDKPRDYTSFKPKDEGRFKDAYRAWTGGEIPKEASRALGRTKGRGCWNCATDLASRLDAAGIDRDRTRVVTGKYSGEHKFLTPEQAKTEPHVWVELDGKILDPTAGQFEDYPNMDPSKYIEKKAALDKTGDPTSFKPKEDQNHEQENTQSRGAKPLAGITPRADNSRSEAGASPERNRSETVSGDRGRNVREAPFRHWSNSANPGLEIDPAKHGKGAAGAETARKRDYPELWVDRSYIGLPGYEKEGILGNRHEHTGGTVDRDLIYDLAKDPLNIYAQAEKAIKENGDYAPGDRGAILSTMESMVRDHGFLGYSGKNGAAAIFHKIPARGKVDFGHFEKVAPNFAKRSPEMMAVVREFTPEINRIQPGYFEQHPITPEQAKKQGQIAKAYEALKVDNLGDSKVRKAYDALTKKIKAQWEALEEKGITIEPWREEGQPYGNSKDLQADLRKNKHLYYFPTDTASFGSSDNFTKEHPMLQESGFKDAEGKPILNNDVLRAVHDAIAHGSFGVQFGPAGEEAAWKAHMATVDDPWARWALTTETRGQNSWVNFRDQFLGADGLPKKAGDPGYIKPQDRPFADQKADLLPLKWVQTGDPAVDAVLTPEFLKESGVKFKPRSDEEREFYKEVGDGDGYISAMVKSPRELKSSLREFEVEFEQQPKGETMWIDGVYLEPEKRGKGTGSSLVRDAIERARELNVHRVALVTSTGREVSFYSKLGFSEIDSNWLGQTLMTLDVEQAKKSGGYAAGEHHRGSNGKFKPRDLSEHLKDASPFTKDEDGNPKTFFHGTPKTEELTKSGIFDKSKSDPNALYGPGFYFTDEPLIAGGDGDTKAGYATGGNSPSSLKNIEAEVARWNKAVEDARGTSAEGSAQRNLEHWQRTLDESSAKQIGAGVIPAHLDVRNPFDIESKIKNSHEIIDRMNFKKPTKPEIDPEVEAAAWKALRDGGLKQNNHEIAEILLDNDSDLYYKLQDQLGDDQSVGDYLKPWLESVLARNNPTTKKQLKRDISQITNGQEFYERAAKVVGKGRLNEALKSAGYDGITHVGGGNTGNDPHRVVIAFEPEQIIGKYGGLERKAENPKQFKPKTQGDELNLGKAAEPNLNIPLTRKLKELGSKFPEAILPQYERKNGKYVFDPETGKTKVQKVNYELSETPLAKEAAKGVRGEEKRKEAISSAYADKLVENFKQIETNPEIMAGKEWYRVARTKIKKLFGDDTVLFAQLLGATSARTPVHDNYKQAVEAYNLFKRGEYDGHAEKYLDLIKKLRPGERTLGEEPEAEIDPQSDLPITDASGAALKFRETYRKTVGKKTRAIEPGTPVTPTNFKDFLDSEGILPKKSNGAEYNANSVAVLRVLAGVWEQMAGGPKTPNFAGNLSGKTLQATIDVWAARNLHRLGNEGNTGRWRILPESEPGVVDDDFRLGQDAYRKAAEKIGMNPDDLQGVLWFAEKDVWHKNGWTQGAGSEKSDFNYWLDRTLSKGNEKEIQEEKPQMEFGFGDLKPKAKGLTKAGLSAMKARP